MGKRKSSKKPQSRISQPLPPDLDTTFNCLFCHHEKSVTCKIDKKEGWGTLVAKFVLSSISAKYITCPEPIDVYSSWIDACDEAQASTRPAVSSRRLAAIESDED
ncbi:transcription elongation factor 1 [Rhizoctonia solani]|uniref:Transcription elongation factor 1 homolog n=1 Tax=Rhizoctonia solani TaxID=456999 RepID=A0A8H8PA89_9AGAM|nr:transcription elongation factor 1 [Rhizoctonia solani]QRW27633.1 transcription elongation factor 1 [Rhizoctonia solani]